MSFFQTHKHFPYNNIHIAAGREPTALKPKSCFNMMPLRPPKCIINIKHMFSNTTQSKPNSVWLAWLCCWKTVSQVYREWTVCYTCILCFLYMYHIDIIIHNAHTLCVSCIYFIYNTYGSRRPSVRFTIYTLFGSVSNLVFHSVWAQTSTSMDRRGKWHSVALSSHIKYILSLQQQFLARFLTSSIRRIYLV